VLAVGGLVDHHRHNQAGIGHGSDAHKGSHIFLGIDAVFQLVGGPGLAPHPIARHLGHGGGAPGLHHQFQHVPHFLDGLGRKYPLARHRPVPHPGQGQGHHVPVPGEDRIGMDELDQAHGNTVAVGHGGLLDGAPVFPGPHPPGHFTGETQMGHLAEAQVLEVFPHFLIAQGGGDLGRAHVGRLLDHLGHGQVAVGVGIVDGGGADGEPARRAMNDGAGLHPALFQGQGNGEGLHGGAWLEGIGHRPVAQLGPGEMLAVIGVVGRPVGQGQDFPVTGIHHHGTAALGVIVLNGFLQLAEGQILDFGIQGQGDVLAILRRLGGTHVFHHLTAPVLDHGAAAVMAHELVLEGQFHPFQTLVVNTSKAHDVGSHFPGGVVAAVFLVLVDTRQFHLGDALPDFRGNLAFEVNEVPVLRQAPLQFPLIDFQQGRQALGLFRRQLHVPGNGPDGFHGGGNRQNFPIPVRNPAPGGEHVQLPPVAGIPLLLKKIVIDDLEIEGTAHQGGKAQEQHEGHKAGAPGRHAQLEHRAFSEAVGFGLIDPHQGRPP